MTYAIIETGGKQLKVEPGRFYDVDRLPQEPDTQISVDKVLLVHNGTDVTIGQPFVSGATVEATVLQHLRGRKILVYKMRPKKKTRKKQGHRAELTRLMINAILIDGTAIGTTDVETPLKSDSKFQAADEMTTDDVETVITLEAEVMT